MTRIVIPSIPESERTPIVDLLLLQNQKLSEKIEILEAEIARLKKQPPKPKIKPSKMDKDDNDKTSGGKSNDNQPGKKSKKGEIEIDEIKVIKVDNLPKGARFKGYRDFDVQDIEIKKKNTRYRLEVWELERGEYITATLPKEIKGNHFGSKLRSYLLHQYHHQQVTQPLLLEQIREFGIDISSGELNNILIRDKKLFHEEKKDLLRTGLSFSEYIHVDDTGARHKGKNGYCTHIGNDFFAYFESSRYKNRINFLGLLRMGYEDYVLNKEAIEYCKRQGLSIDWMQILKESERYWTNEEALEGYLGLIGMIDKRYKRITTEAVLLGSAISHGLSKEIVILSDDAGQFNILLHALCWIHAERAITKIVPYNENDARAIEETKKGFWEIYKKLKSYKINPTKKFGNQIAEEFDKLCSNFTGFATLNNALRRLKKNKEELLLVLEYPYIPLQNNLSERDIREYVKRRKISGSTRSDSGRECRDTFASLKKTCKKLKISFWDYLNDRIFKTNSIPRLSDLVAQAIYDSS